MAASTATLDALDAGPERVSAFLEITLDVGALRLTNEPFDISVDGQTFLGDGTLGRLTLGARILDEVGLEPQVVLSGLHETSDGTPLRSNLLSQNLGRDLRGTPLIGRPCAFWIQMVEGRTAVNDRLFPIRGRAEGLRREIIKEDNGSKRAVLVLSIANREKAGIKRRGRVYSQAEHQYLNDGSTLLAQTAGLATDQSKTFWGKAN